MVQSVYISLHLHPYFYLFFIFIIINNIIIEDNPFWIYTESNSRVGLNGPSPFLFKLL